MSFTEGKMQVPEKERGAKWQFNEYNPGVPQYFSFSVNYEAHYIFRFKSVHYLCACAHAFIPWHRGGGHRTTCRSHFSLSSKFQESNPGHQAFEGSAFSHRAILLTDSIFILTFYCSTKQNLEQMNNWWLFSDWWRIPTLLRTLVTITKMYYAIILVSWFLKIPDGEYLLKSYILNFKSYFKEYFL